MKTFVFEILTLINTVCHPSQRTPLFVPWNYLHTFVPSIILPAPLNATITESFLYLLLPQSFSYTVRDPRGKYYIDPLYPGACFAGGILPVIMNSGGTPFSKLIFTWTPSLWLRRPRRIFPPLDLLGLSTTPWGPWSPVTSLRGSSLTS